MPRRAEVQVQEGLAAQGMLRQRPAFLLQRQLVALLCALAALWWMSVGHAQSAVYYADDIQQTPARTQVSPGYLTLIEFYQDIDQISSGRPDLLHVEAVGSKIYVSALGRSGATDLVVEVGARTQLLHVQIAPGSSTRRYVVMLDKPPPPPAKPVAPKPAPPVKTTPVGAALVKAAPVKSAPGAIKPAPVKPVSAKPVPATAAPVAAPVQPSPVTPPQPPKGALPPAQAPPQDAANIKDWRAAPQPSWLSFRVIERNLGHSDGEVTLFFALENSGSTPLLVIDAADLHATQNGTSVPVKLRQGLNPATLRADRTHQGTLVLALSAAMRRAGPITLSWTLRDPGKQLTYTVVRQVNPLGLN
jgi:hypothetical protein